MCNSRLFIWSGSWARCVFVGTWPRVCDIGPRHIHFPSQNLVCPQSNCNLLYFYSFNFSSSSFSSSLLFSLFFFFFFFFFFIFPLLFGYFSSSGVFTLFFFYWLFSHFFCEYNNRHVHILFLYTVVQLETTGLYLSADQRFYGADLNCNAGVKQGWEKFEVIVSAPFRRPSP